MRLRMLAFLAVTTAAFAQTPAYMDPARPLDARVDDLLQRMTLEEKASQLLSASPAIPRLGVPAYNWWNECLHGVARAGRATVFPETIGMAATWDSDLILRVATTISDEARAKHHEFLRRGKRGIYEGLTFWTPNINLFRDPRWGRGMETWGEDPYLTGSLAVQFVRGLQGDDPKYLKTIATPKHYAVHSGPESSRHVFDARVDERDLRDTYLAQFEMAVTQGKAESVMCSYNRLDGDPACGNSLLLDRILRKQWGFGGYVVSDCGAISDIYGTHKRTATAVEGAAMALKAGCDLDCGLEYENVVPAIRQGLLTEADVDTAVRRLLRARFRLGIFDPPSMVPWSKIPYSVNESREHGDLALETARRSIVLLKNENGLLPLRKDLRTIAVIGPNADSVDVLLGNYNGEPSHPVTPLAGIRAKVGGKARVLYALGSGLAPGVPVFETVPDSALFTSNEAAGQPGLKGDYYSVANFDGRAYFSEAFVSEAMRRAAVIPHHAQPLFSRVDPKIDFDWADSAPRAGMDDDNFGVRWAGYLKAPASGQYYLGANGINAFELYFDGKLIAQADNIHERSYEYNTVDLEAGKLYPIRLDFHEVHGNATIRLVWSPVQQDHLAQALDAARQADVVVMALGLSPRLEGEELQVKIEGFSGGDRVSLGIPKVQEELLEKVSALGKPVVLVLLNGSAVAINWAREHVPAIVELWYPGQAGGTALADVLFGDFNPAGRLPVTFYKSADQLPPFEDYAMKGRTYRYFTGEPLFPFGYGLSYTTFAYRNLQLPASPATGNPVRVSVEVENTGKVAGEEVVELYLKHLVTPVPLPVRSLAGFQRVFLQPGEKKTVEFTLDGRQFSYIGADNRRVIPPSQVEISVGGKQPGFSGPADAATTGVVSGRLRLMGEPRFPN